MPLRSVRAGRLLSAGQAWASVKGAGCALTGLHLMRLAYALKWTYLLDCWQSISESFGGEAQLHARTCCPALHSSSHPAACVSGVHDEEAASCRPATSALGVVSLQIRPLKETVPRTPMLALISKLTGVPSAAIWSYKLQRNFTSMVVMHLAGPAVPRQCGIPLCCRQVSAADCLSVNLAKNKPCTLARAGTHAHPYTHLHTCTHAHTFVRTYIPTHMHTHMRTHSC